MREVVRSANDYDVDVASFASALLCEDESLTVQSQKDEADINVLVARFRVTGQLPVVELPAALVGHFESFDMMTAQNLMIDAQRSFMSLDPKVRDRFGNDPVRFVAFASDEKNVDELRKLGLAKPKAEPVPEVVQKVQVVEVDDGDSERAGRRGGRSAARVRGADKADPESDR